MTSLRDFISLLENNSKLIRVKNSVSARFEVAAIIKEFEVRKAILFEKIEESSFSLVAGVCGDKERVCMALNTNQENLYKKILNALKNPTKPVIVDDGEVKEVIERPDLKKFPILTHYEKEKPYITSSIISARSPDGENENISVHRLQVLGKDKLAIRIVPRHLYKLCDIAKKAGKKTLEVAISIGVHPAVLLAAASSAPFGLSEYWVANTILDGKLRLTRCEIVDLNVPANAEIVFEGEIVLDKNVQEGPFVDLTQTYDAVRFQPIVRLLGVMRRRDCIYQALLPAGFEHRIFMGLFREAKIWKAVKEVVPTVKAVKLTDGGCGWLHAFISIKKQLEGDGKNAILAAFIGHPSLKHVIVVDEDINIENFDEVEWALATRFQGDRDMVIVKGVRGSTLDPSANQDTGTTTKIGFDATKPLSEPQEKFEKINIPKSDRVKELLRKLKG